MSFEFEIVNALDSLTWGALVPFLDSDTLVRLACTGDSTICAKIRPWVREIEVSPRRHILSGPLNLSKYLGALSLVIDSSALEKLEISSNFTGSIEEGALDWLGTCAHLHSVSVRSRDSILASFLLEALLSSRITTLELQTGPNVPSVLAFPPHLTILKIRESGIEWGIFALKMPLPPSLTHLELPELSINGLDHLSPLASLRLQTFRMNPRYDISVPWGQVLPLPSTITELEFSFPGVEQPPEKTKRNTIASLFPCLVTLKADLNVFGWTTIMHSDYMETKGGFPPTLRRFQYSAFMDLPSSRSRFLEAVGPQLFSFDWAPNIKADLPFLPLAKTILNSHFGIDGFLTHEEVLTLPPRLEKLRCQLEASSIDMTILPETEELDIQVLDKFLPSDPKKAAISSIPSSNALKKLFVFFQKDTPVMQDLSSLSSLTTLMSYSMTQPIHDSPSQLPPNLKELYLSCPKTLETMFLRSPFEFVPQFSRIRMLTLKQLRRDKTNPDILLALPPRLLTLQLLNVIRQEDLNSVRILALPRSITALHLSYAVKDEGGDLSIWENLPPYLETLQVPDEIQAHVVKRFPVISVNSYHHVWPRK